MTDASTSRAHRPGEWLGVFGARTTVLLPASARDRAAAVWQLVDEDSDVEVVLDRLLRDGLRSLPDFAVISVADDRARVVVRGAASASLTTGEESLDVVADDTTPWTERTVTGLTGWRLRAGVPAGDPAPLPASALMLRVAEVWAPADRTPGDQDTPAATARPGTGKVPTREPDADPPPPPVGSPSGPPPPVTGTASPATEHDGLTVAGGAGTPASRPVARLVFSHGEEVVVDRAVLVGRAPEARRFAAGVEPRLVTVPSPAHEISSTHLEIRPGSGADLGSAVVTDLGSTNGTVVVQPGLPPDDLRPGIAVQLIPGAIIDLGDGVTIQVINP